MSSLEPREIDILRGRGASNYAEHAGNRRFNELIKSCAVAYAQAPQKKVFAERLVDHLQGAEGRRFFTRKSTKDPWRLYDDREQLVMSIQQNLRDANRATSNAKHDASQHSDNSDAMMKDSIGSFSKDITEVYGTSVQCASMGVDDDASEKDVSMAGSKSVETPSRVFKTLLGDVVESSPAPPPSPMEQDVHPVKEVSSGGPSCSSTVSSDITHDSDEKAFKATLKNDPVLSSVAEAETETKYTESLLHSMETFTITEGLTPAQTNLDEEMPYAPTQELEDLLTKKLKRPDMALTPEESMDLLMHCVSLGENNAKNVKGKDASLYIGNTGAGKSTFVNYLLGCQMESFDPDELGIRGEDEDVVVVSTNSMVKEVMGIGHGGISKTFIPQIKVDPHDSSKAHCDCPGFLDNRGAEINIANAVNVRRAIQSAKSVKIVIVINYHTLKADRSRGLRDMITICKQLFGSKDNLGQYKKSLSLCVTRSPSKTKLPRIQKLLTDDQAEIMTSLANQVFLYDPLDEGGEAFHDREGCVACIGSLQPIPAEEACSLFQTVLEVTDEKKLLELVEYQGQQLRNALSRGDFAQVAQFHHDLNKLRVIDHLSVERMLHDNCLKIQQVLTRQIATFRNDCVYYRFDLAKPKLNDLRTTASLFRKEIYLPQLELDIEELSRHLAFFEQKKAKEDFQLEQINKLRDQLSILFAERKHLEEKLKSHREAASKEQQRLFEEMLRRDNAHATQIDMIKQEQEQFKRRQEEATKKISAREAEGLRKEFDARLKEVERERAADREEYSRSLTKRAESNQNLDAALRGQLWKNEEEQKRGASGGILMATTELKSAGVSVFGAEDWRIGFGWAVEDVPFPPDIGRILSAKPPFKLDGLDPNSTMKDTHYLVLIPNMVNNEYAFTLENWRKSHLKLQHLWSTLNDRGIALGELRTRSFDKKGLLESMNEFIWDDRVLQQNAEAPTMPYGVDTDCIPDRPYWLLMSKSVLFGSQNKVYGVQKLMVEQFHGYRLPACLEFMAVRLVHCSLSKDQFMNGYDSNYLDLDACKDCKAKSHPQVGAALCRTL